MLVQMPPTDESLVAFGQRLHAAREARGLTLNELSEAASVPRLTLHLVEQGRERADSAAVHRISDALHLPLDFLFSTGGDPTALRPLR